MDWSCNSGPQPPFNFCFPSCDEDRVVLLCWRILPCTKFLLWYLWCCTNGNGLFCKEMSSIDAILSLMVEPSSSCRPFNPKSAIMYGYGILEVVARWSPGYIIMCNPLRILKGSRASKLTISSRLHPNPKLATGISPCWLAWTAFPPSRDVQASAMGWRGAVILSRDYNHLGQLFIHILLDPNSFGICTTYQHSIKYLKLRLQ